MNVHLAQMLKERGVSARAERRSREGVPDVRVELGSSDQIILECKYAGSSGLLDAQLNDRLADFPDAIGIIGVVYPSWMQTVPDVRSNLLSADDIEWHLHGSKGKSESERQVRSGSVDDLADYLRYLPLEIEGMDRVQAAASVVGYALELAAKRISGHRRIARRIADIIAKSDQERDRSAALRIGSLVLFNALAFQDRLAIVDEDVPTVDEAVRDGLEGLHDAWDYICEHIDYVPVFELAGDIVDVLMDGPKGMQMPVVEPLLEAVENTGNLEGHDLSGRLFHTLLSDAKFSGAYYTSVPAATMLARLVFHDWPAGVDWSDHEFPASINVADLACGTGTLLMAVAAEVERKHTAAGGTEAADLHKAMVEQALYGYDVQLSAIHFAATSLAMLNPNIKFDRMSLYVMPLGAQGSNRLLGSLEFLNSDEAEVQFALSSNETGVAKRDARRVSGSGARGVDDGETAKLPDLDLAIMNPPFTKSGGGNLLFGSLPQAERRRLQDELSLRLKSMKASASAGLGAAFVAAASPKLRKGEGRLALVLPATVCTGNAWTQTRALIEHEFNLDTVVVSHDPTRWNFSDSTDLSEALLIATRKPEKAANTNNRTTFVNLWRNPNGVVDAHRLADAINSTQPPMIDDSGTALLEIDGEHVGEVIAIPDFQFTGKKWSGVQFARADVLRSALRLLEGSEVWVPGQQGHVRVPMCLVKDIGSIGPDRRRLIDGFEVTSAVTAYPMIAGHETERRKSLACEPDAYLSPLAKPKGGRKPGYGDHLWQSASRLLISERLRLDTARVAAMRSDEKVLSNVFWEIQVSDIASEKVLTVWINSSLGILTILGSRTSTMGGWVAMKKADLGNLPILDPSQLTQAQLKELSDLFDDLADAEFERLPAMAQCPARIALDDGISEILGLPDLSKLRDLLASEPVVSNRGL